MAEYQSNEDKEVYNKELETFKRMHRDKKMNV